MALSNPWSGLSVIANPRLSNYSKTVTRNPWSSLSGSTSVANSQQLIPVYACTGWDDGLAWWLVGWSLLSPCYRPRFFLYIVETIKYK